MRGESNTGGTNKVIVRNANGTGSGGFTTKTCYHGRPKLVFDSPIKVYAGSAYQSCDPPAGAIVIDLADMYGVPVYIEGFEFQLKLEIPKRIRITWPDYAIPRIKKPIWVSLAKSIIKENSPIFIACQGGHGRTGSALAILGGLLGCYDKDADPVLVVRTKYCDHAVETQTQIDYVEKILDSFTVELPSLYSGPITTMPVSPRTEYNLDKVVEVTLCVASNYTYDPDINCSPHTCGKFRHHRANHECDNCKFQWRSSYDYETESWKDRPISSPSWSSWTKENKSEPKKQTTLPIVPDESDAYREDSKDTV